MTSDRSQYHVPSGRSAGPGPIRPLIAVHLGASPRLLNAMLCRGEPREELIGTIEVALAKMEVMDPYGALERAREETDWG